MTAKIIDTELQARRSHILKQARWCFLNFGYAKTSLEDIATRADLSRTLLYKIFKNKEDIYLAVYQDWLASRHPAAIKAIDGKGSASERLFNVCTIMVLEPWIDMVDTPMGAEFFEACEKLDPEAGAKHRQIVIDAATKMIGDKKAAEVFVLSLDGLLSDQPKPKMLEDRMRILIARFTSSAQAI